MASIYKRGDTWWIQYMVDGNRLRESLETANERVGLILPTPDWRASVPHRG